MSNRFFLGNMSGVGRVRTAKLGYDVTDPALDPRYLTFDSTWVNSLRLVASGEVAGGSLGSSSITYPGWGSYSGGGYRDVKIYAGAGSAGSGPDRPAIVFVKNYGGTLNIKYAGTDPATGTVPLGYARGYGMCGVSMKDNQLLFSPRRDDVNYVYYIFGNSPATPQAAGANSSLFGNHPTYGPGLFIARPGYNALSAGLDDMMLSTRTNHFQFAETGVAQPNVSPTGYSTDRLNGDAFFYSGSATRTCRIVTLSGWYPHYPPVSMIWNDASSDDYIPCCYWLSPNQICLVGFRTEYSVCRYGVIATDASYVPGTDSSSGLRRCYASPSTGFGVTKHNVDALSAGENDWIFRSDRITPYFNGFESFYAGRASGTYPLPAAAPSGIPFAFMMAFDAFSGWWCGVGLLSTYHLWAASTVGISYGPIFGGYILNNSQYIWYWDTSWTSSVTTGYMATTNVSDF